MAEIKKIGISASSVIKKSAMQICYLRTNKITPPPTQMMLDGVEAQLKRSRSEYLEMRGTLEESLYKLYYSFDEVIPGNPIILKEHKNIKEGSEVADWYLHGSVLQVGYYESLLRVNPDRKLVTASFFVDQGNELKTLELNKPVKSLLQMGEIHYNVEVSNPQEVVNFFARKITSTFNYQAAKAWDEEYKRKEWEVMSKYIKFCLVQKPEPVKVF